ncbi:hypothetical protein [Paenibacillus sp. TAF43_2]
MMTKQKDYKPALSAYSKRNKKMKLPEEHQYSSREASFRYTACQNAD